MKRLACLAAILLVIGCASSMTPRADTRDEIKSYVDRAARLVERSGPSCDTFGMQNWRSGDYYIFVLGADGNTICHPVRADLVGTDARMTVDPNGKRIGDAFLAYASGAETSGWVDYVWARPGQTTPEPKSSYVKRVTGPDGKVYVVGSGGYALPR